MKKIEFENITTVSDYVYLNGKPQEVRVELSSFRNEIELHVAQSTSETRFARYTDPAKLDALGDAIKRAAQALRDSQRLTFGDLQPGEWFRFETTSEICGANMYRMRGSVYAATDGLEYSSSHDRPVTRLKATFEVLP